MTEPGQLRWRCRRGMRELDRLMLTWLDNFYADADDESRTRFAELLDWQDPELMALFNGTATDGRYHHIIEQIRQTIIT